MSQSLEFPDPIETVEYDFLTSVRSFCQKHRVLIGILLIVVFSATATNLLAKTSPVFVYETVQEWGVDVIAWHYIVAYAIASIMLLVLIAIFTKWTFRWSSLKAFLFIGLLWVIVVSPALFIGEYSGADGIDNIGQMIVWTLFRVYSGVFLAVIVHILVTVWQLVRLSRDAHNAVEDESVPQFGAIQVG